MNQNNNSNSQHIDQLKEETAMKLKNLFNNISDDVTNRNECKLFLKKLLNNYEKNDFHTLDKQLSKIPKALENLYPKAEKVLNTMRLYVDRDLSEQFDSLTQELDKYCESKGIALKGIRPNYVIEGLIEVFFNKENKTAKVGATFIRKLDWDKIKDQIEIEWKRVWERPFDSNKYRDELISIYEDIMKTKPNPSGWTPLVDVYQKLKEHQDNRNPNWRKAGRVASYYKDEFSADLSKLWQAQVKDKISPPHIEFSAIRDPRRSFKVVLHNGDTTNYGFIRPQRD